MRRRNTRRRRGPAQPGQLRMTSMMDILTVLLLFLLKSFVAEGEVVTPAPGVQLPQSRSEDAIASSLVIAVAADHIRVGDEVVVTLDGSANGGLGDGLYIEALGRSLQHAREQQQRIAARRGHDEEFRGKVTIQGDRELSFAVLQRVMYTCNENGYADVALAVLRG